MMMMMTATAAAATTTMIAVSDASFVCSRCHERKFRLEDGLVISEPPAMCEDPAFGKLYCEADRVALVNMTSFFQHNMPGSKSRASSLS